MDFSMIDAVTYGGLSVAHYVAFRPLSREEQEAIKRKEPHILSRASIATSRVSFIDEIRYSVQLDTTDSLQCMRIDDLELYLLCTCLDTLAGKDNYFDLQNWLKVRRRTGVHGVREKFRILQTAEEEKKYLSQESFQDTLEQILRIYNKNYGINKNIAQLVLSLPDAIKTEFADQYVIYRESQENTQETWNEKTTDEKLKTIFIDYLFKYRRNKYTHEGRGFPNFGGICAARKALSEGEFGLPAPERLTFTMNGDDLVVTCNYGDEALLLREVIIACLANLLGVLSTDWLRAYRKAEQKKRILYALIAEIRYNIRVMQGYFGVLADPLILTGNGYPKFSTKVAQTLLENTDSPTLPLYESFLQSYVDSAGTFNSKIDVQPNGAHPFSTISKEALGLLEESRIRSSGMSLWMFCDKLLEEYPHWAYDERWHSPHSDSLI
jgi:hypothetical protein